MSELSEKARAMKASVFFSASFIEESGFGSRGDSITNRLANVMELYFKDGEHEDIGWNSTVGELLDYMDENDAHIYKISGVGCGRTYDFYQGLLRKFDLDDDGVSDLLAMTK
jgi:hypothetical protein